MTKKLELRCRIPWFLRELDRIERVLRKNPVPEPVKLDHAGDVKRVKMRSKNKDRAFCKEKLTKIRLLRIKFDKVQKNLDTLTEKQCFDFLQVITRAV